ncbi:MAG: hypothetical protein QM778_31530 [Myxococcales bacterium]
MNKLLPSLLLLGPLACAVACGSAQPKTQASDPLEVARLYPLRAGSVWTYDVDTGQGLPTLAITRVLSSDGARTEVSSGADPIVYETRPDGLFRADRGVYVLKAPIRKGASWDAGSGSQAEVVDTDRQVSSPAGDFSHCVEVRETGGSAGKQVRTVFCPDVGPVEVESSMQMELSGQTARVSAKLRGYDFSGALSQPTP